MPRIMIVDTDDEHREILCGTVKGKGVVVEEVVDGYEALAKFRADPPDAVVMAVELSNDLDGVECLGRMKALNNRFIPVILIGESDDPQKTVQALLAGAADYVTKPYAPIVLRTRLRSALVTQMRFDQLAERNREILQLAHVMACDLQDPLHDLTKAVRGLRAELDGETDPTETVQQISDDTSRVANVMHDMMVYASAGAEQLERGAINMGDVVQRVTEMLKPSVAQKGVYFEVECMDEHVFAHEQVMLRIVTNVIQNAIDFVEGESDGRVRVSVRGDQGVVRMTVSDNGDGLAASELDDMFLPFRRALKRSGAAIDNSANAGMSMAIMRRYIEVFGGRLWVDSSQTGTTVVIELPRASQQDAAPKVAFSFQSTVRDDTVEPQSSAVEWQPADGGGQMTLEDFLTQQ